MKHIGTILLYFVAISSYSQPTDYTTQPIKAQTEDITAVAFSKDGKHIAIGSKDKTTKLLSYPDLTEIATCTGHFDAIQYVAFGPQQQTLYTAGDRIINRWDMSGKIIKSFKGHPTYVWSIAISPDEKTIASGSFEKKIRLWNIADGKNFKNLEGHSENALSVAYSPDGKYIASGSLDFSVKLWNATTGEVLKTFRGHSGNIFAIAFSKDGKQIITASADKTIKIWSVGTGKSIRTLIGHSEAVVSLAILNDGKHLLSSSHDRTINLWNMTDGALIYSFDKHKGPVNSLAIDPTSTNTFLSGATNAECFIWTFHQKIFADKYFPDAIKDEIITNRLFDPQQKDEKRADFKIRQEKQTEQLEILYTKYHKKYTDWLNTQQIEPEGEVKITIE